MPVPPRWLPMFAGARLVSGKRQDGGRSRLRWLRLVSITPDDAGYRFKVTLADGVRCVPLVNVLSGFAEEPAVEIEDGDEISLHPELVARMIADGVLRVAGDFADPAGATVAGTVRRPTGMNY